MDDAHSHVIGFDVYGTLVDPIELKVPLRQFVGDRAERFAALWREKQIEYSFRRGLMRVYVDFDVCTRQALQYTALALAVELSNADQRGLLAAYRNLAPFPEARAALEALKRRGHRLFAFSNGVEATVRALLGHAGLAAYLDNVISVDDLNTFKPDPAVYQYLAKRAGTPPEATWLISSNSWDVIGAQAAGLRTAWVQRQSTTVFDPWGTEPELVVRNLTELVERLYRLG
ncbi:MAG TPA: haloacid dehalogenase type II [Nitrolancea sp.]|jgi:2-haloacid dehalogenase|nr:haloacid dehalogenase type II [Nitrolancea sp.]